MNLAAKITVMFHDQWKHMTSEIIMDLSSRPSTLCLIYWMHSVFLTAMSHAIPKPFWNDGAYEWMLLSGLNNLEAPKFQTEGPMGTMPLEVQWVAGHELVGKRNRKEG